MKKVVFQAICMTLIALTVHAQNTNPWPSTGAVGIGTAAPRTPLEVVNTVRVSQSATGSSLFLQGFGMATDNTYSNVRLVGSSANGSGYLQTKLDNWGGAFSWVRGGATGDVTVMHIDATLGNVGIGTTSPQAKLAVNGDIFSKKVKVTQTGWPDYVFAPAYSLRPVLEVERFIIKNGHLPDVPPAAEIEKDGLDLGNNQATLLKKIEELTLYIIQQEKRINEMELKLKLLDKANNKTNN